MRSQDLVDVNPLDRLTRFVEEIDVGDDAVVGLLVVGQYEVGILELDLVWFEIKLDFGVLNYPELLQPVGALIIDLLGAYQGIKVVLVHLLLSAVLLVGLSFDVLEASDVADALEGFLDAVYSELDVREILGVDGEELQLVRKVSDLGKLDILREL